MSNIYIGTSGFSYREWIGKFYPKGMKNSELLSYYTSHFNAVEINSTFYKLPSSSMIESWKECVSKDFRFSAKVSQRITHRKDFGATDDYFRVFFSQIASIGDWFGPLLFQFPPTFGKPERLDQF